MSTITTTSQSRKRALSNVKPSNKERPTRVDDADTVASVVDHDALRSKKGKMLKFSDWDPTLYLENKASVARDHLANERTFLAWLRTSLSFISIGIAIVQLFRLSSSDGRSGSVKTGTPLGITFVVVGIVFLCFGVARYFHSQCIMIKGEFPASRGSVTIGTILTLTTLGGCLVVLTIVGSG
ncbi:9211_t:CDS:2 [Paraglomus brasilianum]|uniref:9211_t:CDS:1 n=1 Tax=Paraglomus brasilianum TaxID=144538 RepID=A0A9N9DLG3_9GLOM|nr:9211_t:CDS:2 [Paraglomus brasilianum]